MSSYQILNDMPFIYQAPELNEQFIKHGKYVLRQLARELRLQRADYDLRIQGRHATYCPEVIFHADHLYLNLFQSSIFMGRATILYRGCDHRKDYTGHRNHFCAVPDLRKRTIIGVMTEFTGKDPLTIDGPLFAFSANG